MGRQEVIVTPLERAIIDRIVKRYEDLGWSERKLAITAGITPSTVHRMLSGGQNLTLAYLEKIAAAFKLKTSHLVSESEAVLAERILSSAPVSRSSPPPLSDEFINQLEKDLAANKYKLAARHHEQEDPTPEQ